MDEKRSEMELPENKIESVEKDGFFEINIKSQTFLRDESQQFQLMVKNAYSKGYTKFLINFGDCQYISSEGLGCVAEFWRECRENEKCLMVSTFNKKPESQLLNFFEIIGLARIMKGFIFTDYKKAKNFILKH
jgi:hypothetical protein